MLGLSKEAQTMNDSYRSHGITRRQFLKASAATATVLAVSDKLWAGKAGSLVQAASVPGQDEWLHSHCRMCTQPKCATLAHIKNGVMVGLEGDSDSPLNAGTLCPRGQGAVFNLYNPYRVKAPLKRTNPQKGLDVDPKWTEISWDEALNAVAQRMQKIKSEDPRKLVFSTGFGSQGNIYAPIANNFYAALGIPGDNKVPSNGPMCSVHLASCMVQAAFTNGPDHVYCDYLITLGSSIGANWATASGPVRGLMNAIDRGMKLIVVDPRAGKEAGLGEWVPIRPGGELAFELGIINVMLHEIGLAKLDVNFLKRRSNAPYLVGANERYVRDVATKKPMVWDPTDNKAKVFDDPTIKDYALEGEFAVNGDTVHPGFTLIKAEVKSNTPEWSEQISTIPAATIRRIANDFVAAAKIGSTITLDGIEFPLRPVQIWPKRGALDQQDGGYVMFAAKVINLLVGAMDVPGADQGTQNWGPVLKPTEDGTVTPVQEAIGTPWKFPPDDVQLSSFFPFKHSSPYLAWRVILNPKKYYLPYDVDMIVNYGSNPMISNAAPKEPMEAFTKVPFLVGIAYHFDEPTMLADIVLPESSNYECEMIFDNPGSDSKGLWSAAMPRGVNYRFPVVQNVYNTKQCEEIFLELATRMRMTDPKDGMNARINRSLNLKPEYALQPDKQYTLTEIYDRDFKTRYGAAKGTAYFRSIGFEYEQVGPKTYYNYAYFPMGKTRYAIFFEHLKEVGDRLKDGIQKAGITFPGWDLAEVMDHYRPIPHWRPMPVHKQPAEYDLYFVNWKTPFVLFGLGATVENPWLYEISKQTDAYQRVISMNPATAAKKGLKEGDMVEVSSQWGKLTGRLKLSSLFHTDVIGTPGNFGRRSIGVNPIAREGINFNQLISSDDGTFEPVTTALAGSPRVKVQKI